MHPILQQIYNSVQSASSILQQIHVEQCTKCNHVATNVHNSVQIATSYANLLSLYKSQDLTTISVSAKCNLLATIYVSPKWRCD
jgi:hypothetical protein